MNVEAWVLEKPAPNRRCFVRAEIVEYDVDVEVVGDRSVDRVEEFLEFDCTMSSVQFANHSASYDIERRE